MKREQHRPVPHWLRLLGCFSIEDRGLRFNWGELYLKWAFGCGYSVYHEGATVHMSPIIGTIYLKAPMVITQRPGTEDWNASYGFSVFERSMHFNWRDRCKVVNFPWDWDHVRHSYYWPDGTLHHHAGRGEYRPPKETTQRFSYVYIRRNGPPLERIQQRVATVNGEEREWRWRWFKWSSWPRKVHRSINVEFNDEVGERTGSWKGGCLGCGYDWRPEETLERALRRMERERKFE